MSEMARSPQSGNVTTIPTEVSDINLDWAKLVINQYRYTLHSFTTLSCLYGLHYPSIEFTFGLYIEYRATYKNKSYFK